MQKRKLIVKETFPDGSVIVETIAYEVLLCDNDADAMWMALFSAHNHLLTTKSTQSNSENES